MTTLRGPRLTAGWLVVGLILALIVIDQSSKLWIQANLPLNTATPLAPGVFYLAHVANRGMAGGLGQHLPALGTILALITAIAITLIVLLYRWYSKVSEPCFWAHVFVVCSVTPLFCTMIDRFRLGYVIDFLAFRGWPVFNFSDMLPLIGIVGLIIEAASLVRRSQEAPFKGPVARVWDN